MHYSCPTLLLLCRGRKTPLSPALVVPIFWLLQLPMDLHYSCPTAALPGKEDTIDPSPSCPNLLAIAIAYGQALLMSYSTAALPGEEDTIVPSPSCPNFLAIAIAYGPALLMSYCCFAGRGRHHCPQPFLSQFSGDCNCLWTCITHVLLLLCRARKTPLTPALLVPIFWLLQLPMDRHYSCPTLLLLCRARKTPLSPALLVPIFWRLQLPMDMHYSCPTAALPGKEDTIDPSPSCPNLLAIAIAYGQALLMSYSTAALPGEEDTIVPSPSCPNLLAIAIAYGPALLMSYCCFAGRGRHHCPQPFLSQFSGYCNCLWTCITHVLLLLCRARKTPLTPALLVPIFWLLQLPMDMHYSCPTLLLLCRARKTPLSPALLVPIFWLLQLPMDMHYSCPTAALPGEEDTIVPSPSCPNLLAIAIAYGHALLMSYSTAALPGEEDTIVPSPCCPNFLAIAIAYGPALLMSYCCFAGRGRHHCPQPFLSQSSGYCNCLWTCITHVLLYCCFAGRGRHHCPQPFLSQSSGYCNCLWTCITHVLLLLCRARKTPLSPALLVPIFWLLQLPMDMHYSCPTLLLLCRGRKTPLSPALVVPIFWLLQLPMDLHYSCPTAALPGEEDTIVPSPSCPNFLAIAIAYGPALLMSYCCFAGRGRHHCPQPFLSQSSGYCNCLWTCITHVLLYCCFAGRGRHHCPQPFLSQFSGYCNCLWTCITHVLLLLCRARKTPLSPALLVPIFWLLQLPMDLHYSCPTAALPGEEDTIVPSPSCPNFLAIAIAYGPALHVLLYCCFAGRGRHHRPQPFLSQFSGYCNCLWICITHVLLLLCRARKTPLSPALLVPIFWLLQLPMDMHYSCPTLLLLCRGRKTPLSPALVVPIFWLLQLPMDMHYSCPTAALPGEEDTIVPSPCCPNFLAIAIAYGHALLMSYCCFAGRGRHHCPQPFLSQSSGDCNCLWTCITHVLLLLCRARKTPLSPALLVPIFWLLQFPMDLHYSCPTLLLLCRARKTPLSPALLVPIFWLLQLPMDMHYSCPTAALPGEEDTIVPSPSCPNLLAIAIAYGHALLMSYCCFAGRGRHHCPQPFLSQSSGYCNCLWTCITCPTLLLLCRARKTPSSPALLVPIFWLLQLPMDMHYSCPTAALPGEEDTIVPSPSCPNLLAIAIAYGHALLMSYSTAALPGEEDTIVPSPSCPNLLAIAIAYGHALLMSYSTAALPGEEDTIVPSPCCPNFLAIAIAYGPALLMSYCCFAGRGRHHCPQPFLSQSSGYCNCLWTCITHVLLLLCRARKTPLSPALLVPIFWLLQLPMDLHYSCPTLLLLCRARKTPLSPALLVPIFWLLQLPMDLHYSCPTAALPGEEDTIVPSPSCPNLLAIAVAYGPALLMSYCCFAGRGRHHCPQPFLSQFSGYCNCLWTCITCPTLLLLCRARKTPSSPALLVPIFWLLQLPMDMHYSCPTAALPGEEDTIVPSPSCPNLLAIAIAYGHALLMSYSTAALPGEEDTIVPSPCCPNFLAIAIAYGHALLMSYCCFAGRGRHHCPQPLLSQFSGYCNCLWTCITHVLLLLCRARKTPLSPALLVPIFWRLQLPMDMHYSCPTAALPGEEDTIVPSPSCPNLLAIAIPYGPALLMSYSTAALPGEEDTIVPSPSCPNLLAIAIAYGHALLMSYCCFAGRGRHHCPQPFLSQSSGYCNCLWTCITHVLLLLCRARKTPLSPALLVPIFWLLQLPMDLHYMSYSTAALPGEEDTIVPSPSCPNFLAIAIAYGHALLMSYCCFAGRGRHHCPQPFLSQSSGYCNCLWTCITHVLLYCCFAGRGRHHCPQPFLSQSSGYCNCLWTCITHVLLLLCRARKTPLSPALLVPIFWLLQFPMDLHYSCPTLLLLCRARKTPLSPALLVPIFWLLQLPMDMHYSCPTAALPGEEDTIVPSPSCPNLLAIAIAYGHALLMSYCCFAGRGRHHCPQPFLSQSSGYCNCLWTCITCPTLLLLCRARKTPSSPALLVPIFWLLQLPMDMHYSCPTAALPGEEDTIVPSPSCPNLLAIAIAYGHALLMSYSTAALPGEEDTIVPSPSCPNLLAIAIAYGHALLMSYSTAALPGEEDTIVPSPCCPNFLAIAIAYGPALLMSYCCFAGRGRHHCPQPFLSQSSGYCNCLWTCITHVLLYCCFAGRGRHHCPQPFLSQFSGYCNCLWTCITHVLLLLCRARKTPLSPALLVPIFWLLQLPMDMHYSCPTAALPGEEDTIVPSPSCPNFLAIAIAYGPALHVLLYCCFAGRGRHHCPQPFLSQSSGYCNCLWTCITHVLLYCCFAGPGRHHCPQPFLSQSACHCKSLWTCITHVLQLLRQAKKTPLTPALLVMQCTAVFGSPCSLGGIAWCWCVRLCCLFAPSLQVVSSSHQGRQYYDEDASQVCHVELVGRALTADIWPAWASIVSSKWCKVCACWLWWNRIYTVICMVVICSGDTSIRWCCLLTLLGR